MPKYYPKSQIKTGLFTNGEEYQSPLTGEPYVGDYFKISNGKVFSGKDQYQRNSIELIPLNKNKLSQKSLDFYYPPTPPAAGVSDSITPTPPSPISEVIPLSNSTSRYVRIKPPTSSQKLLPQPYIPQPTLEDYKIGEFQRFFCKKNNENIFIEISPDYYSKLKSQDSNVLYSLYTPLKIIWTLIGPFSKTYQVNKNIVKLVERNKKWFSFSKYFKGNYLQFHINKLSDNSSSTSSPSTSPSSPSSGGGGGY